ncbi:MAG: hypothetical protein ACI33K_14710, partial [Clostridiaceae bacterium]
MEGLLNLEEIKERIALGFSDNYTLELQENNGEELFLEEEYISLVIIYGKYNLSIDKRAVHLLKGNIILVKKGYRIRYSPIDKDGIIIVLNFKKDFFDSHLMAHMADCPIFYDFLRLKAENMEYLVFDIDTFQIVKAYLQLLVYEVSRLKEKNHKLVKAALVSFLT